MTARWPGTLLLLLGVRISQETSARLWVPACLLLLLLLCVAAPGVKLFLNLLSDPKTRI